MVVGALATPQLQTLRNLVPPLVATRYKGQAGKVGVLGGCSDYTGAPFYAAISALKLGADLSHVFCEERAAAPIKSYSPELMVHGVRREGEAPAQARERQADQVSKWFPALTALVVGPGLGRAETMQAVAALVVERAVAASLPLVIDADGLDCVLRDPSLVRGSAWTVLTPNRPEFGRLQAALAPAAGAEVAADDDAAELRRISLALGGAVIVRKGPHDLLSDGTSVLCNEEPGSVKRSGGQGDVLAGSIATFLGWARAAQLGGLTPPEPSPPLLAAYAGCLLTRRFSAAAFAKHRRAMTAPDLVAEIGPTFEEFSPAELAE